MYHSSFYTYLLSIVQSIIDCIRNRLTQWIFLGVLITIALILTQLSLKYNQTHTPVDSNQLRSNYTHLPDYTMRGLYVYLVNLDRQTHSQLSADSLIHYRDNLSSIIINPILIAKTGKLIDFNKKTNTASNKEFNKAFNKNTANSLTVLNHQNASQIVIHNQIKAKQALLRNEGESIEFSGNVVVSRTLPNQPKSLLQTEKIVLFPDSNQLFSQDKIQLTQGNSTIIANNGIHYTHDNAQLYLKGPIQAILYSR